MKCKHWPYFPNTKLYLLSIATQEITLKLSGLKQQTFIFSQFLWSGIQVQLSGAFLLRVSHKAATKALAGAPVTWGLPGRLTYFQAYAYDCWQEWVPPGLLDWRSHFLAGCWLKHLQFLVTWTSPWDNLQHGLTSSQWASKRAREKEVPAKWSYSLLQLILEVIRYLSLLSQSIC